MNGMYGINLTDRFCEAGLAEPPPALGLLSVLVVYHRAMHDVSDWRSFGADYIKTYNKYDGYK